MSATYRLDAAGFRQHLLNADWMVDAMRSRADSAKTYAESIAPVYEEGPHPGRYRDAFSVTSGRDGGPHHDRACAILSNGAPEALSAEYGTENNEAHHVLTRALSTIGGVTGSSSVGSNTPRHD